MSTGNIAQGVHFVGSIPYPSAASVFERCGKQFGTRLRRIPDGEPGKRQGWIMWQMEAFAKHPEVTAAPEYAYLQKKSEVQMDEAEMQRIVEDLQPLQTGYDVQALESYEAFKQARAAGHVPASTRFQVCLPTPVAVMASLIAPPFRLALEAPYEEALLRAMDKIQAEIPAHDLAIQFDIAVETGILEGGARAMWFPAAEHGVFDRMVRLGEQVKAGVELGFHFCYGDMEHKHFKQPDDAFFLNLMATTVIKRIGRPVNFVQMPVPPDRDDAAYFAPLKELQAVRGNCEVYLGLVHPNDVQGTQRRIKTASEVVHPFGVATECGMGRTPPEDIASIMQTSAEVADPF